MIAKPAEETPLIAAQAVRLLHEAGVPEDALILPPGDGAVGAMLTAHEGVGGVMFTGSTEVAKLIAAALAERLRPDGAPIPLIAETGGQNALIVDSSALAEQVSPTRSPRPSIRRASAVRRCASSACRTTSPSACSPCSKSAMRELEVGPPDRLSADVGPVISAEALANLNRLRRFDARARLPRPRRAAGRTLARTASSSRRR